MQKKSKKNARAGEFWSINNKQAKGHKGLITKRKNGKNVEYIQTTHKPPKGTSKKFVKLQENPQKDDKRDAYISKKVHKTTVNKLGKQHREMKVKNKTDKSIIRKIKSNNKKRR